MAKLFQRHFQYLQRIDHERNDGQAADFRALDRKNLFRHHSRKADLVQDSGLGRCDWSCGMTEEEARKTHSIAQVALTQIPLEAEVSYVTADGLEIKELYFAEPGIFMGQHAHHRGHAHVVGSGEVRVWVEEIELGDFKAGQAINIEAGKLHMLMSLKKDTRGFCIHNVVGLDEIGIVKKAVFPGSKA